jgi:hypothetical protein
MVIGSRGAVATRPAVRRVKWRQTAPAITTSAPGCLRTSASFMSEPAMTPHELAFSLAVQAIDDPDAREVRDDAIEEAGLTDRVEDLRRRNPVDLGSSGPWYRDRPPGSWGACDQWDRDAQVREAAALLVLDWSTEMWPVVARCGQWRTVTEINEIAGTITFETAPKAANPYEGGRVEPKGWTRRVP